MTGYSVDFQKSNLKEFLQDFDSDTAKVMNQLPARNGEALNIFNDEEKKGSFVDKKDQVRQDFIKLEGRAGFGSNDRAENLVDAPATLIRNLDEMDRQNLQRAELEVTPWSDDYWAISKGILGARYADPNKSSSHDWLKQKAFSEKNPVADYVDAGMIDILSPAEKYDLLVGDKNFTLTKYMWSQGEYYQNNFGKVETWMGICHGWAAAAYMLDRPEKPVEVLSADGEHKIKFFPADIKALGSLLWAQTNTPSRFVGGRCNEKEPKKDATTGRVVDQQCFDTNPGTWHMAVVNQIGVSKRSFVIDATFDYEVWNHPVQAYRLRYFNPETYAVSSQASDVTIALSDYKKDKLGKYRDSRTKKIVGVEMVVTYVVETHPEQREFDDSRLDAVNNVTYRYDLELDSNNNIIGGEWYTNAHPDFLWTPAPEARAKDIADGYITKWGSAESVPSNYTRVAPYSSAKGQPLAKIVEELIERAKN